jgi:succinoglycan biosynthesis transport protein ExoP
MHSETQALTLERLSAILRRRWWVIAVTTVVVTGASFGFSVIQRKQYTATASVLFGSQQNAAQVAGLQVNPVSSSVDPQIMATNVQLLAQQSGIAEETARVVRHGLTASAVSRAVSVSQEGQTTIAGVSATTSNPSLAADIANTYAARFIAAQGAQHQASAQQGLRLVERQIAALPPPQLVGATGQALLDRAESLRILANIRDGGVRMVSSAAPPGSPSSPQVKRNVALGVVLGLLLGLGFAFLVERLDRRITDVEEVATAYDLPLLAAVPHRKSYSLPPRIDSPTHQSEAEVFKLLRAYLRYFNVDRTLRRILIASAASRDGKTTIARNLAEAAQETGTETLLLEADLRRPVLANHYGLSTAPGLSELLIGRVAAPEAIRAVPIAARLNGAKAEISLDVLVAGHPPPNPPALLQSKAMADVLSWVAAHYDLVVVDTPPLGVVSDAMALLGNVDGVVLVSRMSKNTRDEAMILRGRLLGVSAPLLGVVANDAKAKAHHDYGYADYREDHNVGYRPRSRPEGRRRAGRSPAGPPPVGADPPDNSKRAQLDLSRRLSPAHPPSDRPDPQGQSSGPI